MEAVLKFFALPYSAILFYIVMSADFSVMKVRMVFYSRGFVATPPTRCFAAARPLNVWKRMNRASLNDIIAHKWRRRRRRRSFPLQKPLFRIMSTRNSRGTMVSNIIISLSEHALRCFLTSTMRRTIFRRTAREPWRDR